MSHGAVLRTVCMHVYPSQMLFPKHSNVNHGWKTAAAGADDKVAQQNHSREPQPSHGASAATPYGLGGPTASAAHTQAPPRP
jgi:hypothetical protein